MGRKLKILCVIDNLGSGGAQRQLVNLAIGFKKKGHEVSILVYHRHNFYQKSLDEQSILVHEIIEPNYFKRLIKMRRYIRSGGFHSVLSFLGASNFICEMAGLPWRKWKLVVGERSANPNIFKSPKLIAYRWFHLLADHVVANSHENINIVRKINPLLSSKKCHVIYNTVDFEIWKPDTDYTPVKNGKFKLIIAASHLYLKNLNGLVEAVNLLSMKEKEKLQISWYGSDGHDSSKKEALVKIEKYNLRNIFFFFEPTLVIHDKLKEADAVGLFSFYEGLPNTICEAMASGKPIISSNVSDINKLLNHSPVQICSPNDFRQISERLSYFIAANSRKMKDLGRENFEVAKRLFNKEQIVEKYLNLLG